MDSISLSSVELCCTHVYNIHTYTHTHTHTHTHTCTRTHAHTYIHTYVHTDIFQKLIFRLRELGNIENHRNLRVKKFHRYRAIFLRKQKPHSDSEIVPKPESKALPILPEFSRFLHNFAQFRAPFTTRFRARIWPDFKPFLQTRFHVNFGSISHFPGHFRARFRA